MVRTLAELSLPLLLAATLAACGAPSRGPTTTRTPPVAVAETELTFGEPAPRPPLVVPLMARGGSKLSGTARLSEERDGVRVVIDIERVSAGNHGVHIHMKADCRGLEAKNAGEHFSPEAHPHALPPEEPRHLGDLGNIVVKEHGHGHLETIVLGANLRKGDAFSFIDRAVIVHENPDDGSQPGGNSGERIGCGEIRR
jgi:superoxide dismutase, Cu-Zn family